MPSSMIFAGLVVVWLLILVPAVSRHRQEVERPTVAALSGRVLERSRRRQNPEVDVMDSKHTDDQARTVPEPADPRPAADHDEIDDGGHDTVGDRRRERPPPRYRPGRGGYDPEAAALTAGARYAFRQRVVLALLFAALGTGVLAAVAIPGLWWAHGAVDISLVGYLVYLRRQVRLEESIRDSRAARMAGTRRRSAEEDPELDERADHGDGPDGVEPQGDADRGDLHEDEPVADDADDPERVVGVGEPLAALRERDAEPVPALPRLPPAPPPPLPPGTSLVEADDEGPDLPELDSASRPDYRRAVGE